MDNFLCTYIVYSNKQNQCNDAGLVGASKLLCMTLIYTYAYLSQTKHTLNNFDSKKQRVTGNSKSIDFFESYIRGCVRMRSWDNK